MNKENLHYRPEYQPEYQSHWPETKQRFENTWKRLVGFNDRLDQHDWDQDSWATTPSRP